MQAKAARGRADNGYNLGVSGEMGCRRMFKEFYPCHV